MEITVNRRKIEKEEKKRTKSKAKHINYDLEMESFQQFSELMAFQFENYIDSGTFNNHKIHSAGYYRLDQTL